MPTLPVLDSTLHYRESGDPDGLPFVFLHGNPTSSHLWRNVLPGVAAPGRRLLAPDLIGMGDSGKPDLAYSFDDHARYLDAWFDALGITEAVLVGHDWGGALAFDRAARLPGRVRGIAFTETIIKPLIGDEFPKAGRELFTLLRTPGVGEEMILEKSLFIEGLPDTLATPLAPADLEVYRRPFPTPQSRRPVLAWTRMMPLDAEPADVVARIAARPASVGAHPPGRVRERRKRARRRRAAPTSASRPARPSPSPHPPRPDVRSPPAASPSQTRTAISERYHHGCAMSMTSSPPSPTARCASASTWTVVVAGPAPASDTVFLYGAP